MGERPGAAVEEVSGTAVGGRPGAAVGGRPRTAVGEMPETLLSIRRAALYWKLWLVSGNTLGRSTGEPPPVFLGHTCGSSIR